MEVEDNIIVKWAQEDVKTLYSLLNNNNNNNNNNNTSNKMSLFLNAFAKLRRATVSFVISVCLSVRREQLCSHWTDYH